MSLSGNASANTSANNVLIGDVHGINSIHGKSAYELAVIHGFEGTEQEWIDYIEGNSYVLTEAEKNDVANRVKEIMDFSVVTPQMYGAVGDGVTDDTEAIQQAISNNPCVYIPKGKYKVTDLTIGGTTIIGCGCAFDVYGVITITNSYNTKIENISFNAYGENREYLMCIEKSYYGMFENLRFRNPEKSVNIGVVIDSAEYCYYHTFFNGVFSDFVIGMKLTHNANAHLINQNVFYMCDTGILIDSCDGNRITNNTFQTFSVCGLKMDKTIENSSVTHGNIVMGNYFEADGNKISSTYLGNIDLSNNTNVKGNYFIGNQWTWFKTNTHIVNSANDQHMLDSTHKDYNTPNSLMGFTKHQVLSDNRMVYGGSHYLGTVAPFEKDDGTVEYYVYGKTKTGAMGWQKILTTGLSESDTITLPRTVVPSLHQYNEGYIQLGYDYTGTKSNAVTIETNLQLIKRYNEKTGKWEYQQKVDAGSTDSRPTWKPQGYMYYDNTLGKPIWSKGNNTWVDSTGSAV